MIDNFLFFPFSSVTTVLHSQMYNKKDFRCIFLNVNIIINNQLGPFLFDENKTNIRANFIGPPTQVVMTKG
jgi:hypothetical protein